MNAIVWILSILTGILFGAMILGFIIVVLEIELSFKVGAIIFLISMVIATLAIRREINGD